MAVDRVARRRERADQILALDPSQGYHVPRAGRPHQAALAHRARLSGAQAGGRAWAFRGQRVARLPPPRHAVHRRLRIPGLREGDDFPLWTLFRQAVRETYGSQRLPTQRLRRCEPNDTSRTRSRHCAYASASPSPADYRDAHAAQLQYTETYHAEICDAVVLAAGHRREKGNLAGAGDRRVGFDVGVVDRGADHPRRLEGVGVGFAELRQPRDQLVDGANAGWRSAAKPT